MQKIPRIQNEEEKKRVLMDLQVVMKSHDCPYIVKCFGLLIAEVDRCCYRYVYLSKYFQ